MLLFRVAIPTTLSGDVTMGDRHWFGLLRLFLLALVLARVEGGKIRHLDLCGVPSPHSARRSGATRWATVGVASLGWRP